MKRVTTFVILSFTVHLLCTLGVLYFYKPAPKQLGTLAEFEIIDAKDTQNSAQIVRSALLPEKLKAHESEDPLKFLSEETQRVKKQTRAAANGMTNNRAQNAGKKPNEKVYPQTNEHPSDITVNNSLSEALAQEKGYSTFGEIVPKEVSVGNFTALNTDRAIYYSFYARVEELFRYNWENSIQTAIDSGRAVPENPSIQTQWRTLVEILLLPDGKFSRAIVLKPSGITAFDHAAVESFKRARMFPNPYKAMVKEDGLIHLRYMLQVNYEPKVLVRGQY